MEDFKIKSFEELEAMTAKEVFEYRNAELEHKLAESVEAAKTAMTEEAEKETPDSAKLARMEKVIETLKSEAIETGLRLKAISEKGGNNFEEAITMATELKSNMDAIKSISKGGEGELTIKTDLVRSAISGNTQAQDVPGIGQLAHRKLTMYDLFPKIAMGENNNGTIRYWDWDSATVVRAAEMRAENTAFPESTAAWTEQTITIKKVGDTLPVSAEFFEDEAMFAAELNLFLLTNVALIVDYQIALGTGTGQNLTGLRESATAFTPATVTHVSDPTIYDLLAVAQEQITITGGSKYSPNFAVMRKSTINKMMLSKDANENYIMPPFVDRNGKNVDGLVIIESNIIPDDQIIIGDSKFGKIYEKNGVQLSRGLTGTNFVDDMETLKVRRRLAFLIRDADAAGFVWISDVDAALAAIDATS